MMAEKAMVAYSSTLACKIPWMEEPGRLQSMGPEESDMTELLHFHFSFPTLEKEMENHSSVLAWRIPGTGAPSVGSHRVGHDWCNLAAAAAAFHDEGQEEKGTTEDEIVGWHHRLNGHGFE